ncbi:MAG: ATP-dependent DNA helicase DinG, partial [Gammaproteobacteria bacterium]
MSLAVESLGPDGLISRALANFRYRSSQQTMAAAVETALETGGTLVCEAGTGTGKTFAYLVPALQAAKRVLISTGTKHLQDQLFERDLPLVRQAIGKPVRVALLKGRANYLCLHRLETSRERVLDRATASARQSVIRWAGRTRIGDIAELSEVSESASVWPLVTSTAENCLGGQCDHYDDCFVVKGRRRALDADVVVVNHHLLFADLALREEGFGELLPTVDAVILDEAHTVPQVATQFFGTSVSTRQLALLVDDALTAVAAEAPDVLGFGELAQALADHIERARSALGSAQGSGQGSGQDRIAWARIAQRKSLVDACQGLLAALSRTASGLATLSERGTAIENCADRAQSAFTRLQAILTNEDPNQVVWVETFRRSATWHSSPLEIGPIFGAHVRNSAKAWIFTSATMSVAGSCQHFARRVGLEEWTELCLPSPFNFAEQWLGYLPRAIPQPRDEGFYEHLSNAVIPVLEASQGRAFLLFTSYRGMDAVYERLAGLLPFPFLKQGDVPRHELLTRFRELGNAVLFGTSSFWQGVDVQGDALSCVVIDKLPFEAPGDP